MIQNFADRATERFFNEGTCPARWRSFATVAARKLDMVDAADELIDLASQPGNRLHPLQGDRAGEHAIWINRQWRVTFEWTDAGPHNVKIEDYHKG